MQKKYMVLIALNLAIHVVIFGAFFMKEEKEVLKHTTTAIARSSVTANLSSSQAKADMVYTILIMPKSYLPLLEKFKHHKIARHIQFLPGKIGWDDGKMVVLPKQAIWKADGPQIKPIVKTSGENKNDIQKPASTEGKVLQRAAAIYFLRSVVESKRNFDVNRTLNLKAAF